MVKRVRAFVPIKGTLGECISMETKEMILTTDALKAEFNHDINRRIAYLKQCGMSKYEIKMSILNAINLIEKDIKDQMSVF